MTQKHTKHIRITGIHGTKAAHPKKTMQKQTGSCFQNMNRMRTVRVDGFMVRVIRSQHESANFQFPSILRTPYIGAYTYILRAHLICTRTTLQFYACAAQHHFGLGGSSSLCQKVLRAAAKVAEDGNQAKGFALCCTSHRRPHRHIDSSSATISIGASCGATICRIFGRNKFGSNKASLRSSVVAVVRARFGELYNVAQHHSAGNVDMLAWYVQGVKTISAKSSRINNQFSKLLYQMDGRIVSACCGAKRTFACERALALATAMRLV